MNSLNKYVCYDIVVDQSAIFYFLILRFRLLKLFSLLARLKAFLKIFIQ